MEMTWPDCFKNHKKVLQGDVGLNPWRKFLGDGDLCMFALVECVSGRERIKEQVQKRSKREAEEIKLQNFDRRFKLEGGVDEDFDERKYVEKERPYRRR